MDDWDEAFHSFQVKTIKCQRELLSVRRSHENEVATMEEELETKTAKLDEAKLNLRALADKKMEKKDKIQALNNELSEVQGVLLQTTRQHNSKTKVLEKLRNTMESQNTQASEQRLANEAKRNEMKDHNRKLAARQTELIGYRHETYVLKQQQEHLCGSELDELSGEELQELLAQVETAHAAVAAQEADWVNKQLEYFNSEIQFALAEEDFERASDMKKQRTALQEAEGLDVASPKGKDGEQEEIDLDDDEDL